VSPSKTYLPEASVEALALFSPDRATVTVAPEVPESVPETLYYASCRRSGGQLHPEKK
jgi:hypothetical protein